MKNLLYLSIFTTAIVISWVVFGIYHNTATSTITQAKEIIITPIPKAFDKETINLIKLRSVVEADLSGKSRSATGSATASESLFEPTFPPEFPAQDDQEVPTFPFESQPTPAENFNIGTQSAGL